jgi:hypothetical protein
MYRALAYIVSMQHSLTNASFSPLQLDGTRMTIIVWRQALHNVDDANNDNNNDNDSDINIDYNNGNMNINDNAVRDLGQHTLHVLASIAPTQILLLEPIAVERQTRRLRSTAKRGIFSP